MLLGDRPSPAIWAGFLGQQVENRPSSTNARMAAAVIHGLERDDRRIALKLARSCAKIAHRTVRPSESQRPGRPSKHAGHALLCVLLARTFWSGRKAPVLS